MIRRALLVLAASLPMLAPSAAHPADAAPAAAAPDEPANWPRSLTLPGGTAVVYQPQVEKLEGVVMTGRAALSWEPQGKAPVFGVFWFTAHLQIDKEEDRADVETLKVTKVRFPNISKEGEAKAVQTLEAELPKWDLSMSLGELQAALPGDQ